MSNQSKRIQVSIVVACRNEQKDIRSLVESLLAQDMDGLTWEAIIADGMSDDGTRTILDAYATRHPKLRVIANPGRIVSTGLNAAIGAARGDLIIRMDAHTTYAPDYCRMCVETLERTGADNVGGAARTFAEGTRARAVAAAYHSRFSTGGAKFHDVDYSGWVDTVPYGCWRKATLQRIGLFDESLVRNQDDELNLRLLRAGGKIWQSAAITSWYSPRSTLSRLFRQYFQYGFWKVAIIRKYRIPGSWRHVVPFLLLLANIVLIAGMAIAKGAGSSLGFTVAATGWLLLMASYGIALLFASVLTASRCGWGLLLYLPVVFASYHFSYGAGFFLGLLKFSRKPAISVAQSPESAFTKITR